MLKKYNIRRIKPKHLYSFEEISDLYELYPGTVQTWRKRGLKVISTKTRPYYVYGQNLIDFLSKEAENRKFKLGNGEFFCTKCRKARKSKKEKLHVEVTDQMLGKNHKRTFIYGECTYCDHKLQLFMTAKRILELIKSEKFFTAY